MLIFYDRSQEHDHKQARMQKRYQDDLLKHLPFSMQQTFLNIHGVLSSMKEAKRFVTMKMASMTDNKFNNLLQDSIKVVHVPGTNRDFVAVTAIWVKTYISCKIRTIYECYVKWIDANQIAANS